MKPLTMTEGLLFIAIYFLPWLVASLRRKRNRAAIGLLNLLLGWTVIGWVTALIWAAMKDTEALVARPDCHGRSARGLDEGASSEISLEEWKLRREIETLRREIAEASRKGT